LHFDIIIIVIIETTGLMPDFVMCRSPSPLHRSVVAKLALFTQVSEAHIIGVHDVSNLYAVPLLLQDQKLSTVKIFFVFFVVVVCFIRHCLVFV
jgi:CTP synthase (UTP-ammonia lyase)